ncbi:hypothetical protein [Campylobacter sputorum]|uniref:hypothetical protein n=1 Tax=Campylobacter sputorum TaxID=206 RepID=UPI00053BFE64|nr:hypothetical protein [Campylobacter sputorum]
MEQTDKFKRVKYIRSLEKFVKSIIGIIKRDDFDKNLFRQRVEKSFEILKKVEPVYLDQSYTKGLVEFVNLSLSSTNKDELLKSFNQLEKIKNLKYKKEKHKKNFNEYEY